MKRYYEALDVPQSATIDQIKAQYKQLVRVYHPDRFADVEAKAQAEERFKAINEAYRALTEAAERTKQNSGPKPKPVVDMDLLNFGTLSRGDKRMMAFQAQNLGEPTVNVNYRFTGNAPWFKVAEIQPLQPDQPLPLLFKVETTVEELSENGDYSGLIEVNMDGQIAFVHLSMQLADKSAGWRFPRFKRSYLLAGLLFLVVATSFALFGNFVPQVLGISARKTVTVANARPEDNGARTMPAVEVPATTQQTPLVEKAIPATRSQWSPIFSPDKSQIAFISAQLGAPQVYVRDPQSGKLRQLTHTPEPKAKLLWSPDGLKLAYIAGAQETAQIHVIEVKQGKVQELAPDALPGIIKHFIWEPDSRSVIFDYYIGQEQRFYRGDFQQKQSVLFVPPADWDSSWAVEDG